MPFFLEAAILSRMRSPVTYRSNWAKESRTSSVRRPIEVVVLNCRVTATNDTPPSSYPVLMGLQPSPAGLLMKASQASRCACSELKSRSRPFPELLRV
jgi:hypothetical protein